MYDSQNKTLSLPFKREHLHAWVWTLFFSAPFLWANTPLNGLTANTLYFATALFATAWAWNPDYSNKTKNNSVAAYIFLFSCISPTFILLLQEELRSPWHAFLGSLYITASWIIYQTSKASAGRILVSKHFLILITTASYLYILYSLLQAWDLRFLTDDRLFPVWSTRVAFFPGPLMQQNFEGLFLLLSIIILLFQALKSIKPYHIIASLVPMSGIFLTSSRASLLLLILTVGLFAYIYRKKHLFLFTLFTTLLVALLLAILINYIGIIDNPTYQTTNPNPFERFETGGIKERLAIWAMAIDLSLSHPYFGIGWMNMPAYSVDTGLIIAQQYPNLVEAISLLNGGGNLWAHNLILQFTMSAGFMGLCAIGMIIYYFLTHIKSTFHGISTHQTTSLGNLLALAIFLHGMVSVSAMQPFFMILFAFFLAAGNTGKEYERSY